jgi:hypothetical protein
VQILALLGILDDALAAQGAADRVVAACGKPGPVPWTVSHAGAEQMAVYQRLTLRLRRIPVDPDLREVHGRASRLLAYHLWVLRQALQLAFTPRPEPAAEATRLRLDGLGAPAADLRNLHQEVGRLAAAFAPAEGGSASP